MKRFAIACRALKLPAVHWLAWLAMLLTAVVLTIIIVPGEYVYPWPDETGELNAWKLRSNAFREATHQRHYEEIGVSSGAHVVIIEHGWPRPYLARALIFNQPSQGTLRKKSTPWLRVESWFLHWGGSKHIAVSWSDYDNWPLSSNGWIVDVWGLMINLLVATAIVLAVGSCTQWWLKSRGNRLWTFQLRDLLGFVTLLAIGLGVYCYHAHMRRIEGLAPRNLPPGFLLHDGQLSIGQNYCGPVWLRKLAGNHHFPQLFHHITHASIRSNEEWSERYDELLNFPYLHTLSFPYAEIPIPAFEQLEECRSLKHLSLTFRSKSKQRPTNPPVPTMDVDDLQLLERLHLETIELYGDPVEARHVEQLAALPTLRRIQLESTSAKAVEIESIRQKFPNVTIEILPDWSRFDSLG